jgi:hypothetical protein
VVSDYCVSPAIGPNLRTRTLSAITALYCIAKDCGIIIGDPLAHFGQKHWTIEYTIGVKQNADVATMPKIADALMLSLGIDLDDGAVATYNDGLKTELMV